MGKHSPFSMDRTDPGCVWSMLHFIKYQHWGYIKKKFTPKCRGGGRVVGVGSPGNDTTGLREDKRQKSYSVDMDNSVVGEKLIQSTREPKSSVKTRIKALIAEEISKKKGHHHRTSSCPARPLLKRTDSIHHLQPSALDPLVDPVLYDGSSKTLHRTHKYSSASSTMDPLPLVSHEDPVTSDKRFEECGTMFTGEFLGHNQLNENQNQPTENHTLFQEKLDNTKPMMVQKLPHAMELTPDSSLQRKDFLDTLDTRNVKMALTNCESFPLPGTSGERGSGSSKLTHMQEGIGSHATEKVKLHSQSQKSLLESRNSGELVKKLMPYKTEYEADGILRSNKNTAEFANISPLGSVQLLKTRSEVHENQVVVKSFKDIRQKIKHLIKENRKERHRITMDAILHKIPHGREFSKEWKEIAHQLKHPAMNREGRDSPGIYYSSPSLSKGQTHHMRRTSSLKETMERYSQLYQTSFNREAKYRTSERLILRKEEASFPSVSPSVSAPKPLARVRSLPILQAYTYQGEDSSDAFSSGRITSNTADVTESIDHSFVEQKSLDLPIDSENQFQLHTLAESKTQENLDGVGETNAFIGDEVESISITNNEADAKVGLIVDDFDNLTAEEIASHNDNEKDIGPTKEPIAKLEELTLVSLPDSNFQEKTASPEEFPSSEDSEEVKGRLSSGLDNVVNQQHESGMITPVVVDRGVELQKVEFLKNLMENETPHLQLDAKDKADFNYVRDILKLSGFSGNEALGTWHSDDQPLDPSMYEEVEGCLLPDPDCSGNEKGENCSHLLLFDLINEALMEIYERSYSYCPGPAGHQVLKEVWSLIRWHMSPRPEVHQPVDRVVIKDLAKRDGWMNLKFDTECVGHELEDLILDDLLEEVFMT